MAKVMIRNPSANVVFQGNIVILEGENTMSKNPSMSETILRCSSQHFSNTMSKNINRNSVYVFSHEGSDNGGKQKGRGNILGNCRGFGWR